ncbi:peptidase s1 and s6 chymotrypsin hap : Peptidase S1 and S6 chymotrypsin/Hap OS=Akkermansia muciniphila CAG:154 GN=BN502_00546 PE=4 SV=1: Trypsin_2: Trypsin_2: PDZ_2 [Gemmata massiliana]|uniref:PDZ domain-containing protein n=1 Tax=Gemmata massiliana TaxID=1210884 RepID=A0A6P2CW96_9BACT|nr:trypsin-like peptidase domain-containing protein [Gemmata massiliana]VTR92877.1 peptidase s1 and s6 chymotrypsin hap : Peptidase S1 and S6 chymotrypsin/Hap OS=Akkermansia muciniphila CAG:154 GN=BN502_00546 PE=4 SV=1: Trypsin_2: Trypsin_2: PDZ_2 [Gemmata massiliana]
MAQSDAKRARPTRWRAPAILLLVLAGSVLFWRAAEREHSRAEGERPPTRGSEDVPPLPPGPPAIAENSQPTPPDLEALQKVEQQAIATARKVGPAVVTVLSPAGAERRRQGRYWKSGSGVLISPDGLVLSQLHVSHLGPDGDDFSITHRPGERTVVFLADGREREAELLGANRTYDLSLLRLVDPGPYPFVPLDPERRVRTGDWVLKLGYPLRADPERLAPVRLGRVLGGVPEAFVTDCRMTGGDSGGPFFDLSGQLVGIINCGDAGIYAHFMGGWPEPFDLDPFSVVSAPRIATLLGALRKGDISPVGRRSHIASLQVAERLPPEEWAQGARIKGTATPLTAPLRDSVVQILNGGVPVALGTVVEGDGWVVTRATALPQKPRCRLPDGTEVETDVIGVDKACDLAVLKVRAPDLRPVRWADRFDQPAGTVVAVVGPGGAPITVGAVSVARREVRNPVAPAHDLPLRIEAGPLSFLGTPAAGGLVVDRAWDLARSAGLRPKDRVVSVGGVAVRAPENLAGCVATRLSGDLVSVEIVRDGKRLTLSLPLLPKRETNGESRRIDDLPVLVEYAPAGEPADCGGPLLDLNGRVLGVTVRHISYGGAAIPGDRVKSLVSDAQSGRLTGWGR